jgi:glycine cleavage system aminomethyltransferase T
MQVGGYASEEEEEEGGSGSVAEPIDLRDGGYYAIDSLRLEAGYRAWGHELGVSDTPLDAGLGFTVDWSKARQLSSPNAWIDRCHRALALMPTMTDALLRSDVLSPSVLCSALAQESFIGREALLKLKEDPSLRTNRLVTLHVPDEATPLWGSEPILRDGEVVGNLTSVGYAHSVGGQVGLGYLKHADAAKKGFVKAGSYQIDAGGQLLPATATLKPLIDSKPRVQGDYSNA